MIEHTPHQLVPPPGLQPETIGKMRQILSETLDSEDAGKPANGEKQASRERWLLRHLKIIVLYHLEEDQVEKERIERENIRISQEEGAGVGFNPEQVACLNFLILEKKQEGSFRLKELLQKLDAKMAQQIK